MTEAHVYVGLESKPAQVTFDELLREKRREAGLLGYRRSLT